MSGKYVRYSFTMKELFYLLFKKKKCLKCDNIMHKRKYYEEKKVIKVFGTGRYTPVEATMKEYHYTFYCKNCNSEFKLSDLATRKTK